MKTQPVIVFSCLLFSGSFSSPTLADLVGWGRVNMQGSIIDTACAIAVESREQSIDMGVVPVADLLRDGQGRRQPFAIHLINCVLERPEKTGWHQFQVTFDGARDGDYFGVYGEAKGIALSIMDEYGNPAFPGEVLPLRDIILGNNVLNYTLALMPNQHRLKAGTYFSIIRFKLDYF